jgi:hypothetical protein
MYNRPEAGYILAGVLIFMLIAYFGITKVLMGVAFLSIPMLIEWIAQVAGGCHEANE